MVDKPENAPTPEQSANANAERKERRSRLVRVEPSPGRIIQIIGYPRPKPESD